jgi:hypothetical protein
MAEVLAAIVSGAVATGVSGALFTWAVHIEHRITRVEDATKRIEIKLTSLCLDPKEKSKKESGRKRQV